MSEPALVFSTDPEIQQARRVAWVLAESEHAFGIDNRDLPLSARLENVLQEAMAKPSVIKIETFSMLYKLAFV